MTISGGLLRLRPEQEELLVQCVEAERTQPHRPPFLAAGSMDGYVILHAGFPNGKLDSHEGDVTALYRARLIDFREGCSIDNGAFDITGLGLLTYDEIKAEHARRTTGD